MLDRTGNKADENTINMVQELSVSTPLHFGILVVFLVYDSDDLVCMKPTLELLLLLLVSGSIMKEWASHLGWLSGRWTDHHPIANQCSPSIAPGLTNWCHISWEWSLYTLLLSAHRFISECSWATCSQYPTHMGGLVSNLHRCPQTWFAPAGDSLFVPCPMNFAPGGEPLLVSTVVSGRGYNIVRFFVLLMLLVGIGPGYWKINTSLFRYQVPALQRHLHLVFGTVY